MKNLYFVAHQDDELNNTGVLLARETDEYYEDTYVILCTDGGGSGVINVLGNNESCWIHEGCHNYSLSRREFSIARDKEFYESCSLLGVKDDNVIIHKNRGFDGSLSEEQAEFIIRDVMSLFPEESNFRIRAVSPYFIGRQNPDHKSIGIVCERLFNDGLFSELILVADSCFEGDCRKVFSEKEYSEEKADDKAFVKIKAAADCYGKWEPENGRFSIGWHSVKGEFEEIVRNPVVVYEKLIKISE